MTAWRDATRDREVVRDQARRQPRAEGQERRVPHLRRRVLLRGVRVRRPESVRHPRAVCRSRQHQRQLQRLRRRPPRRAQHGLERRPLRGHAAEHPVRLDHRRFVRTRTHRPTSSGTRRRRSPSAAGRSRCASRSRRSATRTSIRRRGASCSTATTRATATISSSRRAFRATATASSAAPTSLTGLEQLPAGGHIVAAPYAGGEQRAERPRRSGPPLGRRRAEARTPGVDVKYLPNADNAIDLTIKPDFSQVESDTAQIATNQRFALFFPEKRPFFLEGVDLFATPIQAVYTRTITAPIAGGRVTGKAGRRPLHGAGGGR